MQMKKKLAVVMGGYSSERQISLKSGKMVYEALKDGLYDAFLVDIGPDSWNVLIEDDTYPIEKEDFSFRRKGKKIQFDMVFNAIHGHPGEDGIFTAYLDLIGIPYSCSRSSEMMLTFDKRSCNAVLAKYGIRVPPSIAVNKGELIDPDRIDHELGFPCFVKPARSGSSFGVSRVERPVDLEVAQEHAFSEDSTILIERAIEGSEMAVGVYRVGSITKVLAITEIRTTNAFFDYEAKYEGKNEEITPAQIPESVESEIRETAIKVFDLLGLHGFARADFIIEENKPYLIEINTVPGLSRESILPQQVRYNGMSPREFYELVIQEVCK